MTRAELILSLHQRQPRLARGDVEVAVKEILSAIGNTLSNGGRCEFRGFGSFQLNYRAPRIGRNPRTGEKISVPAKYAPHFRPAMALANAIESLHPQRKKPQ